MRHTIERLEERGFTGTDADLATSLFEYGIAWTDKNTDDGDWLFYYGINGNDDNGYFQWSKFDHGFISKDTDVFTDYDWVDWESFLDCIGMDKSDWLKIPLPYRIADLANYHGTENIFGSTYWEGFDIIEEEDGE